MSTETETGEATTPDGTATAPEPVATGRESQGPGLERAAPATTGREHLKSVLESLLFVSDRPVQARVLARAARARTADVRPLLAELARDYEGHGIQLSEVAGGWQLRTAAANAPFVRQLLAQRPVRLSRAQLETLSIAAYRQPVTKPEIDDIRGVDTGSALKVLAERGLIKVLGRKDEPGRPLLYGTTPKFLELFGLKSLSDLPTLQEFSELSDESRALFERKTGETLDLAEAEAEARAAAADAIAARADEGSGEDEDREDEDREDDSNEDDSDEDDDDEDDDEDDEDR